MSVLILLNKLNIILYIYIYISFSLRIDNKPGTINYIVLLLYTSVAFLVLIFDCNNGCRNFRFSQLVHETKLIRSIHNRKFQHCKMTKYLGIECNECTTDKREKKNYSRQKIHTQILPRKLLKIFNDS